MIRIFKFAVEDETYGPANDEVESEIIIDDSEYGLSWAIDGRRYRLSSRNVIDLREILAQVEDDPSN